MAELLTPSQYLELLEGHRRLTLRTAKAFSEKDLFQYSPVEPMRPFAALVAEMLRLEEYATLGLTTGEWVNNPNRYQGVSTLEELLEACESVRSKTLALWSQITVERLTAVETDQFGEMRNFDRLQYALDNEIHHRGQGYVYLRLLGIQPPPFYER